MGHERWSRRGERRTLDPGEATHAVNSSTRQPPHSQPTFTIATGDRRRAFIRAIARQLAAAGVSWAHACAHLRRLNQHRCYPPLPPAVWKLEATRAYFDGSLDDG